METKKEWVTPEIYDLDVDKTATGDIYSIEIGTSAGPTSS
jgi:hypothetical protein